MKVNTANDLSLMIKSERKKQHRSQEDVSSSIGIKQPTLSTFEKQSANSRIETLFKIVHELGLELHLSSKKDFVKDGEWTEEW